MSANPLRSRELLYKGRRRVVSFFGAFPEPEATAWRRWFALLAVGPLAVDPHDPEDMDAYATAAVSALMRAGVLSVGTPGVDLLLIHELLRAAIYASIQPAMQIGLSDAELQGQSGTERIEEWAVQIADWAAVEAGHFLAGVTAERDCYRAALERIAGDGGGLDVFLPVETLQGIAQEALGGNS